MMYMCMLYNAYSMYVYIMYEFTFPSSVPFHSHALSSLYSPPPIPPPPLIP